MSKKHNRLIVIGDGIVYRYKENHYVSGSAQLDFYECFEGIDDIVIWSRIYDISENDTKKYSVYDTKSINKRVVFSGIYNQPPGLKGYIFTLLERIKKINRLLKKPAVVICDPISISQWIMWIFFRNRDLIFISRTIGDISSIRESKKPNFFWKPVIKFTKNIQKNYFANVALQTWVSYALEKKYCNPNIPSVVFHDGLIYDHQITKEVKYRNSNELQLIFVGRLSQEKGISDLINAIYHLSNHNIKLKIVGDGEERRYIENQISNYGLADNITLLGEKKWGEELFEEIRTSDVLVLPSYSEGLPMVIIEAMSCGVPVIASIVGGIPEIVTTDKNGILCSPQNVKGISDAINLLYNNEPYRISLCKNAIISAHDNAREKQLEKFRIMYTNYIFDKL